MVTFIIPVRHHENSMDWGQERRFLFQTAFSASNQTTKEWQGVVVTNRDSRIPKLPDGFSVVRVDLPPNGLHDLPKAEDRKLAMRTFALDKGHRVRAGMRSVENPGYFMVIDDDDLVSNQIAAYVSGNSGAGWYVQKGYVWDGAEKFAKFPQFNTTCGSCNIIKADLIDLSNEDPDYIAKVFGSHATLASRFGLQPLPFYGAIYRLGHLNSHSGGHYRDELVQGALNPRIRSEFGIVRWEHSGVD